MVFSRSFLLPWLRMYIQQPHPLPAAYFPDYDPHNHSKPIMGSMEQRTESPVGGNTSCLYRPHLPLDAGPTEKFMRTMEFYRTGHNLPDHSRIDYRISACHFLCCGISDLSP